MTDHDAPRHPDIRAVTHSEAMAADRELGRLRADYPQFRFSREGYGRHGLCWVAKRTDRLGHGVHIVITTDLMELRDALDGESRQPGQERLTRNQALRALL